MERKSQRVDGQLVELAGRNWLASELQRAGLEVARPERDRGVDLIVYVDRDNRVGNFVARPIQMKTSRRSAFSIYQKYSRFPGLILAYVWNIGNPAETISLALTYLEAFSIAEKMGWTRTDAWIKGGVFLTNNPSKRLRQLLTPYEMNAEKWWAKITTTA